MFFRSNRSALVLLAIVALQLFLVNEFTVKQAQASRKKKLLRKLAILCMMMNRKTKIVPLPLPLPLPIPIKIAKPETTVVEKAYPEPSYDGDHYADDYAASASEQNADYATYAATTPTGRAVDLLFGDKQKPYDEQDEYDQDNQDKSFFTKKIRYQKHKD